MGLVYKTWEDNIGIDLAEIGCSSGEGSVVGFCEQQTFRFHKSKESHDQFSNYKLFKEALHNGISKLNVKTSQYSEVQYCEIVSCASFFN
jgi:hypothetical protein